MPELLRPFRLKRLGLALSLGLSFLLGACSDSRLLIDGQYLVRRNRVELAKDAEVENWSSYALEVFNQIEPQANGRILFLFRRERIYLRSIGKDTTRFRSFVRRILAEQPALLDTNLVASSATRIRSFVRNRGYFNAEVDYAVDTTGKHSARVTYTVQPGQVYRFDSLIYATKNPAIDSLVTKTRSARLLKEGARVDSRSYDQEVLRLVSLMRDNGYADFYANSIAQLDADSSGGTVRAALRILPPTDDKLHHTYTIGRVTVFPDSDPLALSQTVSIDTTFDGIRIIYEQNKMQVEPLTLAENIFFRPGQRFDQSAITKTNLQLNLLGVFRLINIQQTPSSDSTYTIDFFIQCTPAARRSLIGEPNVAFTERQFGGSNIALLGFQLSGGLTDNNVFGGAERLTVGLDAGVEFNIGQIRDSSLQRLNTLELGFQTGLELPHFVDYFGLYRWLHGFRTGTDDEGEAIRFINDDFYQTLRERSLTRFQLGARYTSQLNLFTETALSGTFSYSLTKNTDTWTLNHLGLEYYQVEVRPAFQLILDRAPALQRSFGDQVFTAFLLRGISFARLSVGELLGKSRTWLIDFEQSGAELLGINAITNSISGASGPYRLGPGLDYARYGRLALSLSESVPLSVRERLAWRIATGAALTFGYDRTLRDVPYLRQFFVGGANSMRGWATRDLGPGGFNDTSRVGTGRNRIPYQQADFRLEGNLELRGPLGRVSSTTLDYAIFVDAGNIWTLQQDDSRPLSVFSLRERFGDDGELVAEPFYRQVAINGGVGVRWDIQFALLRFDLGVKLRNPYKIDGTYFPRRFDDYLNGRFGFGLGLNYPF